MAEADSAAGFLPDYDGIILRTEVAKAAGWLLGSLYLRSEIRKDLVTALSKHDKGAVEEVREICKQYDADLTKITALAGMSRKETCDTVWGLFLNDPKYSKEDLNNVRTDIKDVIIDEISEPIDGNISFFAKAWEHGIKIGLVTQTTTRDIQRQSFHFKYPLYIFSAIVAAGDKNWDKNMSKAIGYAIASERLNVNKATAFEDSKSGLESALAAGIPCIGVKDLYSNQDLSKASLIISPDLGHLANDEVMEFYKQHTLEEFIKYLKEGIVKKQHNDLQNDMKEKYGGIVLEYLSNLPLHIDTWDHDPDKENADREDISFDITLREGYNSRQLEEILKIIKKDEIPVRFRRHGGVTKNPDELYMTSRRDNVEREMIIYSKEYQHPTGNFYSGVLPKNFADLR